MKILHLLNGDIFGGVERGISTLIEYYRGITPHIVCLKDGFFTQKSKDAFKIDLIIMRSKFDYTAVTRLKKYVKTKKIDLIHAHTLRANLVGSIVSRLTGIPIVVSIHSPSDFETTNFLKNFLNNKLEKFLIRWTTAYISVSESLKERMIALGVPADRISAVINGTSVERFSSGDAAIVYSDTGLTCSSPLIGTIALLRPRKGIEFFLKASSIVLDHGVNAEFVIVGDAADHHYKKDLQRISQDLNISNKVHFIPFRDDIANVLAAFDVFVLPSIFGEGLPMVILEAMAAGKPVIATAVEGSKEAVIDGKTGILVPPRDAKAIAVAVEKLIFDPELRLTMGVEGKKRVLSSFTAERMIEEIEMFYKEILAGGKNG